MSEQGFSFLWLFVLLSLAFVIVFPIMWLFVVWIIGAFGGWQRMAQRYRAQQPATGKQWLSQYGFVSRARYGNALNVTTNDAGLHIAVMPLFAFNHPPLFIPWSDLHNPRPLVFRRHDLIQVDVGHPPIATLRLPRTVLEQSEGRKILDQSSIGTNVPA
jgi:hypothetical protein